MLVKRVSVVTCPLLGVGYRKVRVSGERAGYPRVGYPGGRVQKCMQKL